MRIAVSQLLVREGLLTVQPQPAVLHLAPLPASGLIRAGHQVAWQCLPTFPPLRVGHLVAAYAPALCGYPTRSLRLCCLLRVSESVFSCSPRQRRTIVFWTRRCRRSIRCISSFIAYIVTCFMRYCTQATQKPPAFLLSS